MAPLTVSERKLASYSWTSVVLCAHEQLGIRDRGGSLRAWVGVKQADELAVGSDAEHSTSCPFESVSLSDSDFAHPRYISAHPSLHFPRCSTEHVPMQVPKAGIPGRFLAPRERFTPTRALKSEHLSPAGPRNVCRGPSSSTPTRSNATPGLADQSDRCPDVTGAPRPHSGTCPSFPP